MGFSKGTGSIVNFWPDNTDTTLYLARDYDFDELIVMIKHHFGQDCDMSKIKIGSEHIHTNCIYYDSYDPNDWTDFIVITLEG